MIVNKDRKGALKMKKIMAVCVLFFCIPALCIGQEFKIPNKFKHDEPILADKFNENYEEIEKQINDLKESLKNMIPKGTVAAFALLECPTGWSDFNEGAGRVIIGVGKGDGLTERKLLDDGGEEMVKLTIKQLPTHSHPYIDTYYYDQNVGAPQCQTPKGDGAGECRDHTKETRPSGENQPHNNMPPFIVLRYCKKL